MDQRELYTSTWNALGAFDYAAANKFSTRFLRVNIFIYIILKCLSSFC